MSDTDPRIDRVAAAIRDVWPDMNAVTLRRAAVAAVEAAEAVEPAEVNSKKAIRRADKARDFPFNTCGASRHAQMIGEALVRRQGYPMLDEEPEHCGESILSAVASLFEARTLLRNHNIDPWSGLPVDSAEHAAWKRRQLAKANRRFRSDASPSPEDAP